MRMTRNLRRRGLTLVELLTAISLTILLAGIAIPAVVTILRGDRLRSASASVQGMLTNARERAAIDRAPRGVRLIPDADNPEISRRLVYIRESPPVAPGGAAVTGYLAASVFATTVPYYDTIEVLFDREFAFALQQTSEKKQIAIPRYWAGTREVSRGVIRLGASGQYRSFSYLTDTAFGAGHRERTTAGERRILLLLDEPLASPVPPIDFNTTRLSVGSMSAEISRPPVPLEGTDPLVLPPGIVIDLGQLPKAPYADAPIDDTAQRLTRLTPRLSVGLQTDPANPQSLDFGFEIMFGPAREVVGPGAVDDQVVLWIRDESNVLVEENAGGVAISHNSPTSGAGTHFRRELTTASSTANSLVVLSTRTGDLRTFKPVLEDGDPANSIAPDGFFDWRLYLQNVTDGVGVNE